MNMEPAIKQEVLPGDGQPNANGAQDAGATTPAGSASGEAIAPPPSAANAGSVAAAIAEGIPGPVIIPPPPKAVKIRIRLVWAALLAVAAIAGILAWLNVEGFRTEVENIDPQFYYFLFAGFVFAMIDGAIGMSYGVTSIAFSQFMGISQAAASTGVHLSEILSNGIAGWMHWRMHNINKRLFILLVIPGSIGAVLGAYILSNLEHYSIYMKPFVSAYTLFLGILIVTKSFNIKRKQRLKKIRQVRLLGLGGGFIDAIGGGGWGSIVLSALIAGGRNPRTALGTVKLSRFFIAILSSITFILALNKNIPWSAVLGLVIGSAVASPIAARVSNKISAKTIMVAVGIIVILVSLWSIYNAVKKLAGLHA
ncbi:sulfite exporter TauE/SafE family protein [Chitinophaga costaii]|nr:sulfite exporter TauE/SafE family protein [Chitinophaga costaii]